MLDAVTVGGLFDSVKALTGLAKATADAVVDEKVREQVYKIREGLMDLQERALDAQKDRMDLLQQIADLRRELDAIRTKDDKLSSYEMYQFNPKKTVYRSKQSSGHSVDHYACPDCYSKGVVSVLQGINDLGGVEWKCQQCDFHVWVS